MSQFSHKLSTVANTTTEVLGETLGRGGIIIAPMPTNTGIIWLTLDGSDATAGTAGEIPILPGTTPTVFDPDTAGGIVSIQGIAAVNGEKLSISYR